LQGQSAQKGRTREAYNARFHIEQTVRYKLLDDHRTAETGLGATVNMSSGGIWLTTDHPLSTGMQVELAMNWPVFLNGSCPMKLMIYGCVLRSNDHGAAVAIERYEFRTQSREALREDSNPCSVVVAGRR
jgi:hypothetical protein